MREYSASVHARILTYRTRKLAHKMYEVNDIWCTNPSQGFRDAKIHTLTTLPLAATTERKKVCDVPEHRADE